MLYPQLVAFMPASLKLNVVYVSGISASRIGGMSEQPLPHRVKVQRAVKVYGRDLMES